MDQASTGVIEETYEIAIEEATIEEDVSEVITGQGNYLNEN